MHESEFAQLLRYLQERMRRYGLADLNDRIVADLRVQADSDVQGERRPSASFQVLRYLDLLESELRLGVDATVRRIVDRFRNVVQTESGRPVGGLSVHMSESDQALLGTGAVDLGGTASNLQPILNEIARFRGDLAESRDPE